MHKKIIYIILKQTSLKNKKPSPGFNLKRVNYFAFSFSPSALSSIMHQSSHILRYAQ